jgi:hypothetical protein
MKSAMERYSRGGPKFVVLQRSQSGVPAERNNWEATGFICSFRAVTPAMPMLEPAIARRWTGSPQKTRTNATARGKH